ncbi:hypothetical protein PSN45_000662 [Yamadazyma tenuis]|nr:hypothetical protein PSN45_000662 [Yamadazyma tenuis]
MYRPNSWIAFTAVIVAVWCLYISQTQNRTPHNNLIASSVFNKIVQCTDLLDGVYCLIENKRSLKAEIQLDSPQAQAQWETCLDIIGNTSDINLLLNIQSCYHTSVLSDKSSSPSISAFAVIISVILQILVGAHVIFDVLASQKNANDQGQAITAVSRRVDKCNEEIESLSSTTKQLQTDQYSNVRNIQGRLTKGGDIRQDIDILKQSYVLLAADVNNIKVAFLANVGSRVYDECTNENLDDWRRDQDRDRSLEYLQNTKLQSATPLPENSPKFYFVPDCSPHPQGSKDVLVPDLNSTIQNKENQPHYNSGIKSNGEVKEKNHTHPKLPHGVDKVNFDILTPEGRETLKTFIENKSQVNQKIRYRDLAYFKNGQRLKRIMVPNRGWVSGSKLQKEGEKYGSDSYVLGTTAHWIPQNKNFTSVEEE